MSERISYRHSVCVEYDTPLEPFYNALLPLLQSYGITAEFPADKPSVYHGTAEQRFSV